ncbi:hypothetical protein NCAS_0C05890 [Naumovozyma castellii]|uniref:Uncharacterized protein n=1 Tax=Naumovozyma castellii TaxID=27288 RepID=G0VDL7_NAUCA|nr:hypothetical protein NCAS_0C05890 [Naumovozyma castellii CBS 4309]CCC69579.1 hypothetical protein NCAS_0C05890 [Naumovozyma castellii CBS 4309]
MDIPKETDNNQWTMPDCKEFTVKNENYDLEMQSVELDKYDSKQDFKILGASLLSNCQTTSMFSDEYLISSDPNTLSIQNTHPIKEEDQDAAVLNLANQGNFWCRFRNLYLKEILAEFLGTMVMIMFGSGVVCQVLASSKIEEQLFKKAINPASNKTGEDYMALPSMIETLGSVNLRTPNGTYVNIALGWASAVVLGYFAAGGASISGAHMNPSITICSTIFRKFPLKKVPGYIFAQLLGAFTGALVIFMYYQPVIEFAYVDWKDNEIVASMFCVFPRPFLSIRRQFISEFISGAILQLGIFSMTNQYNKASTDLFPMWLFLLIFGIMSSMGYQTGTAMNLARDLGPRLTLHVLGFNKALLWNDHNYFFWVPLVAPILGAVTGSLIYDLFIFQGQESPVNWPFKTYCQVFSKFRIIQLKKREKKKIGSIVEYAEVTNPNGEGIQENNSNFQEGFLSTQKQTSLSS